MNNQIQQIIEEIKSTKIKVVSFDLFDTLVFRKCFNPDDIFKIIQDKKALDDDFPLQRKNIENILRAQNKNSEDISLEDIYNTLQKQIPSINKNDELKTEKETLIGNKILDRLIYTAYKYGKKVIITSDIYFSKNQIEYIISSKLIYFKYISEIYTSCDSGYLKRTKNLFKYVVKKEKITASQMLHIGDKKKDDYENAKVLGISSFHLGLSNNLLKIKSRESNFIKKDIYDLQFIRELATIIPSKNFTKKFKTIYELGAYSFGYILYYFSYWVLEECLANKITQLNCLMREGKIFQRYLNKIIEKEERYKSININIVYASRRSLFFPFIHNDDIDDKHLLYSNLLIYEYYNFYRIDVKDKLILQYKKHNIQEAKDIIINKKKTLFDYIHEDIYKRKDEIRHKSKKQIELFKKHLQNIGYTKNSAFVDFGGGASLFNSLNNILEDDVPLKYILFYKHEKTFLYNFKIDSFIRLNSENLDKINMILKYASILELLLNGVDATTLSYGKNKIKKGKENIKFKDFYKAFELGIDEFFNLAFIYDSKHTITTSIKDMCLDIIYRILTYPTNEESVLFNELTYETNSRGNTYNKFFKDNSLNKKDLDNYLYQYINFDQSSDFWPEGKISLHDDMLLLRYRNLIPPMKNKKQIYTIIEKIEGQNIKSYNIFGAGSFLEELYPILLNKGIEINNIYDSSKSNQESFLFGKKILNPKNIAKDPQYNYIVASGAYYSSIKKQIETMCDNKKLNIITCEIK